MKNPKVSIILPSYNSASYMRETINSVLAQSFTDWEFIIIDDASSDTSAKIIQDYCKNDKRIKFYVNKKNLGLSKTLNKGIDLAKGEFIAEIDDDDIWMDKTKLQKQYEFLLNNSDYGIVGCFAHAVDTNGKKLFKIKYPAEDVNIRKIVLRHTCIVHSSILIRKQTLIDIGKYSPLYPYAQDYELFLRIGTVSKLHNIPEFMVHYRINPKGLSRTKYREQHNQLIKIVKKYRKFYPGFFTGYMFWTIRKFYPVWFRGALSRQIKKKIPMLYKLSGA